LPKQLVYDILEYNMVPNKKSTVNVTPPRRPELVLKLESAFIGIQHFTLLASWIDKKDCLYYNSRNLPYHFNLLYRASRDGIDTNIFHNKCNNKEATIVIAKVRGTNQIIGGYNPLEWDSSNSTKSTMDSFLFSFTNVKDINTARIGRVKNIERAIYCHNHLGPAFGPNSDLYYNNCKWYCSQSNYHSINLSFNNFSADDYEVFQVIRN